MTTASWDLLNIDGRELAKVASNAQAMIVDPPYSKRVHTNVRSNHAEGPKETDLGFDCLSDSLRDAIGIIAANVETWSVIYSDLESAHLIRESCVKHGATYIRGIPWVRWSMPQLSGDRPPQGHEILSLFYGTRKGRKVYNGPGNLISFDEESYFSFDELTGMFEQKVTGANSSGKHPAEKPLDQVMKLVDWFTQPGDLVLDPCAGKATVGVAATILGRHYLGAELDPAWHKAGFDRLTSLHRGVVAPRDAERIERFNSAKGAGWRVKP